MIPYARQDINQADIDEIVEVLHSDFLTQGAQVPLFEKTVSNYCNSNYSVAVNSATSANLASIWTLADVSGANAYYYTGTVS